MKLFSFAAIAAAFLTSVAVAQTTNVHDGNWEVTIQFPSKPIVGDLVISGDNSFNGVDHTSPTCNGSTVTGITRAKAEKIWYRALTVYMTSSTNYAGARAATLSAAGDIYGAASAERNAVAAAWSAVSVN